LLHFKYYKLVETKRHEDYTTSMKTKLLLFVAGIVLLATTCDNGIVDGFFKQDEEREIDPSEPEVLFQVSVAQINNGTLSAEPLNAAAGTSVKITETSNAGYMLKNGSLRIQRTDASDIVLYDKPYTFTMPEADVTVIAEFMPYNNLFYMEEDTSGNIAHSMRQILDAYVKPPTNYRFEFPYGLTDVVTAMNYSYWIGDTEVSFELWHIVREWATDAARGADVYILNTTGARGGGSSTGTVRSSTHPVTCIKWYDAVVWCNALTEWYNATYRKTLTPVYQSQGSSVLRNATATAELDIVTPKSGASGFRLPTSQEWELAARWRKDAVNSVSGFTNHASYTSYFTKGEYASGVNSANGADKGQVGVYGVNSTLPVKSKRPNDLGIYDMSGNVAEMCFDKADASSYIMKGQAWPDPDLKVGVVARIPPATPDSTIGFRVARTDVP
jgi:formylglycine-generating enzyme required for sulfatase activity